MIKSDGGTYQCDCSVPGCCCTSDLYIAKGKVVPNEPRCHNCSNNNHQWINKIRLDDD